MSLVPQLDKKTYIDSKGVEKQSALNVVGFVGKPGSGEEGSWDTWSRTLSAQFLSKTTTLIG